MASHSGRLTDKLDKFNPLMCCDESIKRGYDPYRTTYDTEFPDRAYLYENVKPTQDALNRHLKPAAFTRLKNEMRHVGVTPSCLLTEHHGHDSNSSFNTQYCEDYNKVPRRNILPPNRYFTAHKGKHGGWEPEKSDHPVISKPWNHGYIERKREEWKRLAQELSSPELIYRPESFKYVRHCHGEYAASRRYATPLALSSKLQDPRKITSRSGPILFQPNEVHNSSDLQLPTQLAKVELTRRIATKENVCPIVKYPGEMLEGHRESRLPMVLEDS